jgi:hypothetical protein
LDPPDVVLTSDTLIAVVWGLKAAVNILKDFMLVFF